MGKSFRIEKKRMRQGGGDQVIRKGAQAKSREQKERRGIKVTLIEFSAERMEGEESREWKDSDQ